MDFSEFEILVGQKISESMDRIYPGGPRQWMEAYRRIVKPVIMEQLMDDMLYEWLMNPTPAPGTPMGILSQAKPYLPPIVENGGEVRVVWRNGRETVTRTTSYGFDPSYGDIYDITNEDDGGFPAIIVLNRPRRPDDPVITALYIDEKGRPCLTEASPRLEGYDFLGVRPIRSSPALYGSR